MDADDLLRQQRRYGIDDGDGRCHRHQRRRAVFRTNRLRIHQQTERQSAVAGPPAVRTPSSSGRLSVGYDQEGKLTIALRRDLGRTVIG